MVLRTYLQITIVRNMMEMQRHNKEMLQPMYEIIDNALSAGVDG